MQTFILLMAFGTVWLCTWAFFVSLGERRGGFLINKSDRDTWLQSQTPLFVQLQNVATIVGTLTSFATVFLFYLGNSKLFGIFIFATLISLYLSYRITNRITRKIVQHPVYAARSIDSDQAGAVIARMFWSNDTDGRRIAGVLRFLVFLTVCGIIWLEFALFADFYRLLTNQTMASTLGVLFLVTFGVFWFTIKFGIRGFVFADVLQAMLIAICFVILASFVTPLAPLSVCLLFVAHVF